MEQPDPFHAATHALMDPLPGGPSAGSRGVPFALDREARLADLRDARFEEGDPVPLTRPLYTARTKPAP